MAHVRPAKTDAVAGAVNQIKTMKACTKLVAIFASSIVACAPPLVAQLTIPGADGSDGALVITSNRVIDLRQAFTGTWSDNNTANSGKGIYDPNKWAVVFKYSSVTIATNVTVTFSNHLTHAPVVWLVNGDVMINGNLSLDGQNPSIDPVNLPEPGPGGFRGGAGAQASLGNGSGFGPGGYFNERGSYADGHPYGNPQINPLIGGSGGSSYAGQNGGAGGGAILIAASGTISVNGSCRANGGSETYAGSGGAVRLVANQIAGSGSIQASSQFNPGRLRLEANTASASLSLNPPTAIVSPTPLVIWPDASAPTVKVISVAGQSAPLDPKAEISAVASDLTIANSSPVAILLQTSNFPTNGTVNVYVKPRNAAQSILPASYVSGTTNLATWQLTTTLPVNHTVIQARAIAN